MERERENSDLLRHWAGVMKRDKMRYFQVGVVDQTLVLKKIKRFRP